ncbi:MAG: hypothetical protein B7Y35_05995 [Sphingomonadales bacterium 28-64-96]|nr:MAG: hypothetical protein B7Y35_05995 [Sphingomonadales bacterium 28-64-96]
MPRKVRPHPGNYIAAWREQCGLTQEQLAEAASTTAATISRLEAGKVGYTKSMLENIALAVHAEPWELLGRDPTKGAPLWARLQTAGPDQLRQIEAVAETLLTFKRPETMNGS